MRKKNIAHKSIILNDLEAQQAVKLKIGETMTLVRPWKCAEIGCNLAKIVKCDNHCRYKIEKYHPGDILAVKEKWCGSFDSDGDVRGLCAFKALSDIEHKYNFRSGCESWEDAGCTGWQSARSMPIEHARTWLKFQDVKVKKLSDFILPLSDNEKQAWNRHYPRHRWTPELLVCVITAEKVRKQ